MIDRAEQEIMKDWIEKETPIVSICCATYNHENYIGEAMDGFLMQKTDFPFEIVVRDDCSTDKTATIVKEYEKKYPNIIKPIYEIENQYSKGVKAMPAIFNKAVGKYFALCEGDDYWVSNEKLQKQINFLEVNRAYAICFHNAYVINTINNPEGEVSEYQDFDWCGLDRNIHEYSTSDLISSPLCPTASVVFRKPEVFILPDWFYTVPSGDIALEAIVCGKSKIKYLDNFWSVYRKHPKGITRLHKGDFIHKGRISMYLSLLDYFNGDFKSEVKKVIKSHLNEIETYSIFTSSEKKSLMKLLPLFMLKNKIRSILKVT